MNTVIVLFQVFSQPVSQEWTQWLFYFRYLQSVSQEWTQWLFYSRYFHSQCPRNEHSDCSIPGIFTVSVPGMNTVIVLFHVFSQPVSQEWTQWLFYSRYFHSHCPRSEHSDCSIPGIFSQCPRSVHSHCFIPGIFTVSVPGMNTVIVLFQVFSQPVSQEWTQWLFYSRYFHSQCPRSEHSDCSIPGIFSQCPRNEHSDCSISQVFSQSVSQEWTQWLFYSRFLHSQCPRSEHSDCFILGVFTASVPGVYTVTVLFQVFSQPVSQEWTQWLFYSRYHHSQCARSVHSECSILGIFTVSVPEVNTVTVLFQVFLQPVFQECTQWLFYSRYFYSQCHRSVHSDWHLHSQYPRSVHSDCSIPGIFTASVPGVNTVIVLFQVFSQPVSKECTQLLFYSRYFHSQCCRSEHSDCSIPGIFTASVPGMNTVIVLFQVFSQPVSQEWTQWLFYSTYFHSQCPRSVHSYCSIPGIFTASVAGVNTVIVPYQVFSQPVSQEWTQWVFYSRYFHSQCRRNEHSDCSIPGIFTASVPGVYTVTVNVFSSGDNFDAKLRIVVDRVDGSGTQTICSAHVAGKKKMVPPPVVHWWN